MQNGVVENGVEAAPEVAEEQRSREGSAGSQEGIQLSAIKIITRRDDDEEEEEEEEESDSEAEEEENSQSKQNSAKVNEESHSYACMVSNAETSESVIAHDKKTKENKGADWYLEFVLFCQ